MIDHLKNQDAASLLDRSMTASQAPRLHAPSLSFDIQSRLASSPANTANPQESHTAPSSISSGRRTSSSFRTSTLAALNAFGNQQSERQHRFTSEKPIQEYQDENLLMAPLSSREQSSAGYSSDDQTSAQPESSNKTRTTVTSAAASALRKPRLSVNNLRRLAQPGASQTTPNTGSNHSSEARSNLPPAHYTSRKLHALRQRNKWWLQHRGAVDEKSLTPHNLKPTNLTNSPKQNVQHPLENPEAKLERPTESDQLQTSHDATGAEDSSNQFTNEFINLRGEKYLSSRGDMTYWMSYRPEVLDHHILMHYASALMQGSSPFELYTPSSSCAASLLNHAVVSTDPVGPSRPSGGRRRVLDVGCGPAATWCVGVLRAQSEVEVVGLDVCPLLLDLSAIESRVSDRFCFIQHDFIRAELPFEEASFDYVHASFIASGVAEFEWATLLEEMMRVLKPGCPIELLECNQFVADPSHSEPVPQDLVQRPNHGKSRLGRTAHSNLCGKPSTYDLERTRVQDTEALPTTVKQMIEKLFEQKFISSFPLSVIPNELSMISAGSLQRPLQNKFIWLPNNAQNGIRDQHQKAYGSTTSLGRLIDTSSVEAQADPDKSINSLMLQSHVNALAASTEHIWEEVWLPRIRLESGDSSSHILTTNASHILPTNVGTAEAVRGSVDQKTASLSSDTQRQALKPFLRTLASTGDVISDAMATKTGSNHHSATEFDRSSSSFARASKVELQSRKKFEQIWSNWNQSLDSHSASISRLLESRFGWTCQMNTEEHKVLDRRFKEYLAELNDCEAELGQLRENIDLMQAQMSIFTHGQQQDEAWQILRDSRARVEVLLTKESELNDLLESLEPDLITAKRRLGLMDELDANTFGNDTPDISPEKSDIFRNRSESSSIGLKEVSSQRGRSFQTSQGLGKLAIEKFISTKKLT